MPGSSPGMTGSEEKKKARIHHAGLSFCEVFAAQKMEAKL